MDQGFRKARIREVVPQFRIKSIPVAVRPRRNLLGNGFQSVEMRGGIAVTQGMVGNDGFAAAEQLDQFWMHGMQAIEHPPRRCASAFPPNPSLPPDADLIEPPHGAAK